MADPFALGPPWRLRVFINYRRWGWSEEYWLRSMPFDQAMTAALDLCDRRRFWFGTGVQVVYAMVSRGDFTDDTWALNTEQRYQFPAGPWPQPQPPHDPITGWLYREESPDNSFGQRLLRCVPNDWVSNQQPTFPPFQPTGLPLPPIVLGTAAAGQQPPVLPGPGVSLARLQASFLDALVLYCGFVTRAGPDQSLWAVRPLDRVLFRSVSQRPKYHAFRRVSCEPGVRCVGGFWVGPLFSFCGEVVGVVRHCYYAPCRWYVGGPYSGIRFYNAEPGARVYYGQLRFGPKLLEPGWHLSASETAAGEITTLGRRPWYDGTDVNPLRDGSHADVTAQEAAGQAPWIWG